MDSLTLTRAKEQPALFAGVDLGSTAMKMLVIDDVGEEVVSEQVPTPWRAGAGGTTEMDAGDLLNAVSGLVERTSSRLAERTPAHISAIAIAGMGESGILIDDDGIAVAPGFAWFDPRGKEQARAFSPIVRAEFAGRTGLPLGAQVSVAKLAYLRDTGVALRGLRWLNLPEFVAASLGGEVALESSLTSRTGLIDQGSGRPWPAMLTELGIREAFLPPIRDAGQPWGHTSEELPANMAGAALTVAGHDHLVAAEAAGQLAGAHYHVSLGTAEVLLRVIDEPLGYAARARLAASLINEVRHVIPGKHVLVAGVKTGLLLRRVLQAVGINDRAGRDALDRAVMELPYEGRLAPGAVVVSGARNDDGVLSLAIRADGISPAELFGAVLRHSNDEIDVLIHAMNRELPPAQTSTLTGGWAGMASVQRARSRVLPNLTTSSREQETAYGAALFARRLIAARPVLN